MATPTTGRVSYLGTKTPGVTTLAIILLMLISLLCKLECNFTHSHKELKGCILVILASQYGFQKPYLTNNSYFLGWEG